MKKIALAAALVAGLATAAVADEIQDSVRNYGPVAGQSYARQVIEGRNVFLPAAPTVEELWFEHQSQDINS